ncbi:hypothetical protein PN498_03920 [Oscillatoria sp. CS-180]|uniref:hypothetical protein n=1 Tax=Oscillatoria sp. CS-180 TaxID=3021720 RepID=UPI00232CD21A|nr:hypothetical protein [Oscillatoria sp. CS-180]MDB9525123.1 hypothetical protein [Oscillatoria sp. CS-180]
MSIRTISRISLVPLLVAPWVPLTLPQAARAQTSVEVQSANEIQVVTQSDETLYFNTDTTYELPLAVASSTVVDGRSIPAGTIIRGRLEPASGGLRYVATTLEAGEVSRSLNATSAVLADVKDPRETSAESIAGDAAIGAAGGAVIGAVIGDGVGLLEILGGAATGVLVGNVTAQRVVVIEANEPILLQIQP